MQTSILTSVFQYLECDYRDSLDLSDSSTFFGNRSNRDQQNPSLTITSPTSRVVEYCLSLGESTYVLAKQLLANRLYGETTTIPFLLLRLVLARSLIYLNFLTVFSFLHSLTCFLFLLKGRLWFNFYHATQQFRQQLLSKSNEEIKLCEISFLGHDEDQVDTVSFAFDNNFRFQKVMQNTFNKLANHYVIQQSFRRPVASFQTSYENKTKIT